MTDIDNLVQKLNDINYIKNNIKYALETKVDTSNKEISTLNTTFVNYPELIKNLEYKDPSLGIENATNYFTKKPEIYIPNSVKTIKSFAFYNQIISSIDIPNSVKHISSGSFILCKNLVKIIVPESVDVIDEGFIAGCDNAVIYCEAISKPSGWNNNWNSSNYPVVWDYKNNNVADNGVIYNVNLDGITYNLNQETNIAEVSLQDKTIRGDIVIPTSVLYEEKTYSVNKILKNSFLNCINITSLAIPNSIAEIGSYAFSGCLNLNNVSYNSPADTSLSTQLFSNSGTDDGFNITFGDSVTNISRNIFDSARVNIVDFGNAVTIIDSSALLSSTVKEIILGSSIQTIGADAFSSCYYLDKITYNCTSNIQISDNIPIFEDAGKNSQGIQVIFGNNVTVIPNNLFRSRVTRNYNKIKSVEFQSNILSIGKSAFKYCLDLDNINIPESVNDIGYNAFYRCDALVSAVFNNIENWNVSLKEDMSDPIAVESSSLQNPGTAAQMLRQKYVDYYWKRS